MDDILDETLAAMTKNIDELVKLTVDIEKILEAFDKRISDLEQGHVSPLGSRGGRL